MTDELAVFCENIRLLRERNGLTKKQMTEIMGIGMASLNKIEKGIVPEKLKVEALLYTANYFHYAPHELFSPIEFKDKQ